MDIENETDQRTIDNVGFWNRLQKIKSRLNLMVENWKDYEDHKAVIEDILKEPIETFID